jgi:hypothetical protein
VTKIVEPKVRPRQRAGPGQAAIYQQLLDAGELEVQEFAEGESRTVKREGHMGITIVGGFIWPTWSRSRRVYEIEPYNPSQVTGADLLRGQELAAEHGWC